MPPLTVDVQATPNPNAVKLSLNRVVSPQGVTCRDAATATLPWMKELLEIAGVVQVFAVNDFVSINKAPGASWERIVPDAERIVRRVFS